ncbi:YihY/virulence factor BrkB family protein [Comamonadaceae bacterium OTU4NAUVB1]|jgi:membrane protein|nr:YihY/virulence factor BrkB family protein [Comamonadaceae bacterium OTU4NAUVB1]HSU20972.1 YihY/virulence factor BrkB family protein [Variovorax sp.]
MPSAPSVPVPTGPGSSSAAAKGSKVKYFYDLARKAVMAWIDDLAPSMGAAISYYTMFSLAPLLVIVIAVAGAIFGREAVQGEIVTQLQGLIGREGAVAVQGLIKSADEPAKGLIASLISIAVLIVGATTVFGELQSSLDRIWHVPEREKPSGVWGLLRARVLSFGLILGLAFLLMVSLLVSASVAAFGGWAGGLLPGWELLLLGLNTVVSIGITTVLFAMIFKLMPTVRIEWHDVWIGAIVTAVLFEVGKTLIGLYLGKSGVNESFAAAGSLVVLLAWVYYAAQIFLLGAEFTKVYANEHGSIAGTKATAATQAVAAVKEAGTDAVPGAAPHETARSALAATGAAAASGAAGGASLSMDAEAVRRTTQAQREVEERLRLATTTLARQVILLGAASFATTVVMHWEKRQRRAARQGHKAIATLKKQRRR